MHLWQVTTYDVIPVSQSVGLMEFVPDTDQLLNVISPGVIPVEEVDAARKAYSSCAAALAYFSTRRWHKSHCICEVTCQKTCYPVTGSYLHC